MNWNQALMMMKILHSSVRRKNWTGDKYIFYVPKVEHYMNLYPYNVKEDHVDVEEHTLIHTNSHPLGYYATTQCDMMAEDWEVVDTGKKNS